MSELTPAAKELVRAGRTALRPSAADRARVLHGLREQLGGLEPTLAPEPSPSLFSRAWLTWPAVGIAVVCGLGAAIIAGTRGGPAPAPAVTITLQHTTTPVASATETPAPTPTPAPVATAPAATAEPATSVRSPRRERAKSSTGIPASDDLAQEVALLSRAETDLHRGQAALALQSLEEHRRAFPNGTLALERRAARIRVLCTLGRGSEASAELTSLSRTSGGAALARRAREACGASLE